MSEPASFIVRQILKALGANYPIRICVAVGSAQLISLIARAWRVYNPDSPLADLAAGTSFWVYFIISLPICFISILIKGNGAPELAIEQVNTVELIMRRGQISQSNRAMIWRSLLEKYVNAARPDLGVKPDLVETYKEVEAEITSDGTP